MSHSFTYETGWKIIDENGNIRATSEDKQRVETNGTVEVEVLDSDKETVLQNCKQPFKSFVKGFLMDLVLGYRVSARNVGFGSDPKILGSGIIATYGSTYLSSPEAVERYETNVYVDAVGMVNKLSPTINSPSQVYLNSVQKNANSISIKLSSIQQITSGTGTIREVGLFSDNTNKYNNVDQFNTLIAKDVITTPLTYLPNQYVRVKYDIEIPFSNQKVITQNWIYNWLQNLTAPFSGIFKDIEGNPSVGINETSQTFTKATNIQGIADDDTMGIVVGTDGGTLYPVDWDNYKLGNQISHGTSDNQLIYNVTNIPNSEPYVAYTEGIARVTFFRNFTNSSNSNITVKEAGVIAKTSDAANEGVSSNGSYLIARWIVGDVVVKPNETLVVYWQPSIQADSTIASGMSLNLNNVIILTNDLRKQYKGLRNITMIQKLPNGPRLNWGNAKAYAASRKDVDGYGGFTDWRLPIQHQQGTDDEIYELKTIGDHSNAILSGWSSVFKGNSLWTDNQSSNSEAYYVINYNSSGNVGSAGKDNNNTCTCLCVR